MRKIVYSVACSLDGYVARADHSVDWLFLDQDYGFADFLKTFDAVLVGRKTHDIMVRGGQPTFLGLTTYVFSRSAPEAAYPGVKYVSENAAGSLAALRRQRGKNIWLMGGSKLAQTLFQADLIDEIMLTIHPILLGDGIPAFMPVAKEFPLRLTYDKTYSTGLVQLRYERKI